MGTSCCSSIPKKFLGSGLVGGVKKGGVGQRVGMLFVGGPLSEWGPLHVLAGGGGAWWPAVLTGMSNSNQLRRTLSHLSTWASPKAIPARMHRRHWGERGTKVKRWQSDFDLLDGVRIWGALEVSV